MIRQYFPSIFVSKHKESERRRRADSNPHSICACSPAFSSLNSSARCSASYATVFQTNEFEHLFYVLTFELLSELVGGRTNMTAVSNEYDWSDFEARC